MDVNRADRRTTEYGSAAVIRRCGTISRPPTDFLIGIINPQRDCDSNTAVSTSSLALSRCACSKLAAHRAIPYNLWSVAVAMH